VVDRALALATLMGLAVTLDEIDEIAALRKELADISLTAAE
jgi:hypothetical protein